MWFWGRFQCQQGCSGFLAQIIDCGIGMDHLIHPAPLSGTGEERLRDSYTVSERVKCPRPGPQAAMENVTRNKTKTAASFFDPIILHLRFPSSTLYLPPTVVRMTPKGWLTRDVCSVAASGTGLPGGGPRPQVGCGRCAIEGTLGLVSFVPAQKERAVCRTAWRSVRTWVRHGTRCSGFSLPDSNQQDPFSFPDVWLVKPSSSSIADI